LVLVIRFFKQIAGLALFLMVISSERTTNHPD